MQGIHHLASLLVRLSRPLPPDAFTIELISELNEIKEGLKLSQEYRTLLIEKIMESLSLMSFFLGAYNIDCEIVLSEFAASHFLQNDELAFYFMDYLLRMIEIKQNRICENIITSDYRLDIFIKPITKIFRHFYEKVIKEQSNDMRYATFFLRIVKAGEHVLECNHKIDIIQDLMRPDKKFEENRSQDSPFKVQQSSDNDKLFYKNLCFEMKRYIVQTLAETFLQETPKFNSIFAELKDDRSGGIEDLVRKTHALRILKSTLIADEDLRKEFIKGDHPDVLIKALSTIYQNSNYDNKFMTDVISFLFDILLEKNNTFAIKKLYSVRNHAELPVFSSKCLVFLKGIQTLVLRSQLTSELADIFDVLSALLHNPENMRIYKENGGLSFLFDAMLTMPVQSVSSNLYDQLITIYEQMIGKFQAEDVDTFFESFFHTDFIKKCAKSDFSYLLIDLLSVMSIHVSLDNTITSSNSSSGQPRQTNPIILDRILSQEHYYTIIGLLDCGHPAMIEAALKFINVIFFHSQKSKKNPLPSKSKMIPLFTELMKNVPVTNQLLSTVFDLVYSVIENVSSLFPSNSSTVSSILNRSSIANDIIDCSKKDTVSKIPNLANIEFLELLLFLLAKCDDENHVSSILKQFDATLNATNMEKLSDSNFLIWMANLLASQDILNVYPSKVVVESLNILTKLFYYELNKPKNSRVIELLKKIEDMEDLVSVVIKNILSKIAENPIIKNDNAHFLKNLAHLFESVEEIIGLKPDVFIYVLHCINILASKNSGEIRSAMKSEKMFEFRDTLLMDLLSCDLKSTILYNIIKDFSFEGLANQSKFRESHAIDYLIRYFVNNPDYFSLQILILKILKHDCGENHKNIEYVAKIIENTSIINYLYPHRENKTSSMVKCIAKNSDTGDINIETPEITPDMEPEKFLEIFNSDRMEVTRKRIILKINECLIDFENERVKSQAKASNKKAQKKSKSSDSSSKEKVSIQKFINESEIKINTKFAKNLEKYRQKKELLSENTNLRNSDSKSTKYSNN